MLFNANQDKLNFNACNTLLRYFSLPITIHSSLVLELGRPMKSATLGWNAKGKVFIISTIIHIIINHEIVP